MDADHDTEQIIADWHRTLMGEVTALEVLDAIKTRRRSGVPGEDAALVSALHRQLVLAATELMLEAEAVMDEMIGHLPDDVRAAISQIDQHYRRQATAEKAPEAGEEVLAGAKGTGFSRRDVLEMRGRIFRGLGRLAELNEALEMLGRPLKPDRPDVLRARASDEEMDQIAEIHRWRNRLFDELPPLEMVEAIKARRRAGAPGEDAALMRILYGQLVYAAVCLTTEADTVIDEMIERPPGGTSFSLAKIDLNRPHLADAQAATASGEERVELANWTGFFRRELLGMQAQIFGDLGRFDDLNETLEAIMALEGNPDAPDIAPERNFIDHAPPGAIRPDVLERYNAFCPKREGD